MLYRLKKRVFNGYNDFYPLYCDGESEIMSGNLTQEFYFKSFHTEFFWIDDAYEGLIAKQINLKFVNIRETAYIQKDDLL